MMTIFKKALLFCLLSGLVSLGIYRDAFWGASLLAPLDLGPNIFKHYGFMDPTADGIPENHHIVDQFTYDLPLQKRIYDSYHAGEIPWWDPYTYGGRPLLADAHINGTDPVRLLCYAVLPFELAYNWNYILRGILTGLGIFILLLYLRIDTRIALIAALTYQFAGWFTFHFGHPWIQGAFLYYPFLWLMLQRGMSRSFWLHSAGGGVMCAGIFYAGNLQSHAYLVLFVAAFILAVTIQTRSLPWRALCLVAMSGGIGALLAAPVLFNQVEFFLLGVRTPSTSSTSAWQYAVGALMSLGAFYPWMFGTFRTLDVGKIVKSAGMGFYLFAGVSILFFAVRAAFPGIVSGKRLSIARLFALLLVVGFLVMVATPLRGVLYTRCAPLAGMGLIVLASLAIEAAIAGRRPSRRFLAMVVALVVTCAVGSSLLAWFVYPRFQARIEAVVMEKDKDNNSFTSAPTLRKFQIENFANEVSLLNPEAAFTLLAALFLLCLNPALSAQSYRRRVVIALWLAALPVFLFHLRYHPHQGRILWERMLAGGPAQQQALLQVGSLGRLEEAEGQPLGDMVFPNAIASMYGIHVIHGYSALQPKSLYLYPKDAEPPDPEWVADFVVGGPVLPPLGEAPSSARYVPVESPASPSTVSLQRESMNSLTLNTGGCEEIVRTDTFFPGWSASGSAGEKVDISFNAPCFATIKNPEGGALPETILLSYVPRFLSLGLICTGIGGVLIGFCLLFARVRDF